MRRANGIIRAQSAEFWAKEMGKEFLRAPGQSARHRSRLWRSAPKLSITHFDSKLFLHVRCLRPGRAAHDANQRHEHGGEGPANCALGQQLCPVRRTEGADNRHESRCCDFGKQPLFGLRAADRRAAALKVESEHPTMRALAKGSNVRAPGKDRAGRVPCFAARVRAASSRPVPRAKGPADEHPLSPDMSKRG